MTVDSEFLILTRASAGEAQLQRRRRTGDKASASRNAFSINAFRVPKSVVNTDAAATFGVARVNQASSTKKVSPQRNTALDDVLQLADVPPIIA